MSHRNIPLFSMVKKERERERNKGKNHDADDDDGVGCVVKLVCLTILSA